MTSQSLNYQSPNFTSEYFFEETPRAKRHSIKAVTLSSLLLHGSVLGAMFFLVPKIDLNIMAPPPPPPALAFTLVAPVKESAPNEPVDVPQPEPVAKAKPEPKPVEAPKEIITSHRADALNAAPTAVKTPEEKKAIEPEPVVEKVKVPEPEVKNTEELIAEKPIEPVMTESPPIPEEFLDLLEENAEQKPPEMAEAVEAPQDVDVPVAAQATSLNAPKSDLVSDVDEQASYLQQKTTDITGLVNSEKKYPPLAIKRNIEGSVKLALVFNQYGTLEDVLLDESSGSRILDKESIKVAKKALKKTVDLALADETLYVNIEYRLQ